MTHTHVAGSIHADAWAMAPQWLTIPDDLNALFPALWSENVERSPSGELEIAGVSASKLAAEFGTPLYVVDEADLRARARSFAQSFTGWQVYYAGKSMLTTSIARWVVDEGLNLDICTGGELAVAQRAQVPAERIGFHGNNKSEQEIRAALQYGVGKFIVDSEIEVRRLSALCSELNTQANVLVRVTPGVEAHTHEYIATAHEDQKFGLSIVNGQAEAVLTQCLVAPQLNLLGVHAHIGSQIFGTDGFEVSVRKCVALLARFAKTHDVVLTDLGLGGGFGIAYTSQDDPASPAEMATSLRTIVADSCSESGFALPRISIEPGRAISGSSGLTLYTVGTVKPVQISNSGIRHYVSVDGGMSDNIRPALYAAEYSCTLANRRTVAEPVLARVVGKHCESGDIVVRDEFLGADIGAGDLLAVPGTGAYSWSMSSNYNHVTKPAVVAVRGGQAKTMVRRQTIDDLLEYDLGPV